MRRLGDVHIGQVGGSLGRERPDERLVAGRDEQDFRYAGRIHRGVGRVVLGKQVGGCKDQRQCALVDLAQVEDNAMLFVGLDREPIGVDRLAIEFEFHLDFGCFGAIVGQTRESLLSAGLGFGRSCVEGDDRQILGRGLADRDINGGQVAERKSFDRGKTTVAKDVKISWHGLGDRHIARVAGCAARVGESGR